MQRQCRVPACCTWRVQLRPPICPIRCHYLATISQPPTPQRHITHIHIHIHFQRLSLAIPKGANKVIILSYCSDCWKRWAGSSEFPGSSSEWEFSGRYFCVPGAGSSVRFGLLIEMLVRPEQQHQSVLNNRFVSRIAAKTIWFCRYGQVRYLMLIKLSGFSFSPPLPPISLGNLCFVVFLEDWGSSCTLKNIWVLIHFYYYEMIIYWSS